MTARTWPLATPMAIVCFAVGCDYSAPTMPFTGSRPAAKSTFDRVHKGGAVFIEEDYNSEGLSIPLDEIHTLLERDGIPALTDPELVSVSEAPWLVPEDRVAVAVVGGEVIGASLRLLSYHEIVNLKVNDDPVAITYCPLCDSVAVFSRKIETPQGAERVLEFGVSGALYNSNVLMYDREDLSLWSQLQMRAVSGPLVGRSLQARPVEVLTSESFRSTYPDAQLIDPGNKQLGVDTYAEYFAMDDLLLPVREFSDTLPKKTLGLGIATADQAWFVPADSISGSRNIPTNLGEVTIELTGDRLKVSSAPPGVQTAQSFFYAWTAFYPESLVVGAESAE